MHVHPHVTHASWTHPSARTKQHFDRFSRFCRAHDRNRQTDGQTMHATPFVTIGRIYERCGLIIEIKRVLK